MSIRIRVYPQPGSIGARRNRQMRLQQRQFRLQQAMIQREQQLLLQQQLQTSFVPGYGSSYGTSYGYGTGLGYGTGFGAPIGFGSFVPGAYSSSWSSVGGYPQSVAQLGCAPGTSAFGFGSGPLLGAGYVGASYYGC